MYEEGRSTSDIPPLDQLQFDRFSDDTLERAKRILPILEMTEFRWTINDVLEQPEQELDAVFALKVIGEKIRQQSRKVNDDSVERI